MSIRVLTSCHTFLFSYTSVLCTCTSVCRNFVKVLILCGLSTTNVLADDDEDEAGQNEVRRIIITAEKIGEDLMDVSSSVSAISGDEITELGIESFTDLSQHVPNLHVFSWGGRRDTNIFIRGIGPGLFTDPTVGFYVDGVNYSNNGTFDMDLMDVERIEVLRGPQGTLYGGNSLGGVINVVTRKPGSEFEGRASVSYDELEYSKFTGSMSTPLVEDSLSFGFSLSALNGDGHLKNTFLDKDFGARDDISSRAKLVWDVNEKLEAVLSVDFEKFRGDSYAMGPRDAIKANPQEVNFDFEGVDERDSIGSALTIDWEGQHFNMTSITSWRDWDNLNSADQDGGSTEGFAYHSTSDEEHQQVSQELRFNSKARSSWRWIAGLYAYKAEFEVASVNLSDYNAIGFGGPYVDKTNSEKENKGHAAFGQIDFSLTEQLTLTTGIRFDHEERDATVHINAQSTGTVATFSGSEDFDEILPKVVLSYDAAEDSLLYGSVSKGYRAGGFDTLYPNMESPTFDSETSINYELGYKSRLIDNRLSITAALFKVDIDDQQVQQLLPSGTIITDNAAKSSSQGVEFESRFVASEDWLILFSGNYTDAEFDEYTGVNLMSYESENFSGNRLPNAPELTASLIIQNRTDIGHGLTLFSQVDNQYIGSFYFDAPNKLKQDAYSLLNARFGVEAESWSAYLWVKNALDVYYSKVEFEFGFGPTAEASDPRNIGISFNVMY